MRRFFTIYLFICNACIALATTDSVKIKKEYRNTIVLSMANFSIAGITPFDPNIGPFIREELIANQFGVQAEHAEGNNLRLSLGYYAWNINKWMNRHFQQPSLYSSFLYDPRYIKGSRNIDDIGALRHRYGYRMVDASINYRYDNFYRHKFTGGIGLSYTWGTNYYLTQLYFYPPWNSYVYYTRKESEGYAGIVVPVRYDVVFLHNRFAVGVQGNARKYFGLQSWQIDYGFHLSVNF